MKIDTGKTHRKNRHSKDRLRNGRHRRKLDEGET